MLKVSWAHAVLNIYALLYLVPLKLLTGVKFNRLSSTLSTIKDVLYSTFGSKTFLLKRLNSKDY